MSVSTPLVPRFSPVLFVTNSKCGLSLGRRAEISLRARLLGRECQFPHRMWGEFALPGYLFQNAQSLQFFNNIKIIGMMSLHSEIKIQEQSKQFEHPCSQKGPFQFTQGTAELYSELKKCAEWSPLQNARYAAFLELNGSAMEHQPHKKLWGLYEQMAKVVRSRNFRQCKSHHQKMLQAHKAIPGIVSHLLKSVPKFQQLLAGEKDNLAGVQAQKEDKEQLQPTDGSYYPEQPDRIESERSLGGFLKFPHAYPMGLPASKSREEEWRECHQLFIEWTSRLKHLMRNNAFP